LFEPINVVVGRFEYFLHSGEIGLSRHQGEGRGPGPDSR
jgi:hypothetical protein